MLSGIIQIMFLITSAASCNCVHETTVFILIPEPPTLALVAAIDPETRLGYLW